MVLAKGSVPKPARAAARSQRAQAAVLAAAQAIVQESGYPSATIEAIAARSGWPRPHLSPLAQPDEPVRRPAREAGRRGAPHPAGQDPLEALPRAMPGRSGGQLLPGQLLVSLLWEARCRTCAPRCSSGCCCHGARRACGRSAGRGRRGRCARTCRRRSASTCCGGRCSTAWVRHEPITAGFVKQVFEYALAGMGAVPGAAKARRVTVVAGGARRTDEPAAQICELAEAFDHVEIGDVAVNCTRIDPSAQRAGRCRTRRCGQAVRSSATAASGVSAGRA